MNVQNLLLGEWDALDGEPRQLSGSCAKATKKICRDCGIRRARFKSHRSARPKVKWDPDHVLCFSCFRALVNQMRFTKHLVCREFSIPGRISATYALPARSEPLGGSTR
jgi:hypothetical protein